MALCYTPQHCNTVSLTDPVAVESVVVTLGFRGREAGMKHLGKVKGKEIKDQVRRLTYIILRYVLYIRLLITTHHPILY